MNSTNNYNFDKRMNEQRSRMLWLLDLHVFRFFELYLALLFLISTYLRVRQYRAVVGLVKDFRGRGRAYSNWLSNMVISSSLGNRLTVGSHSRFVADTNVSSAVALAGGRYIHCSRSNECLVGIAGCVAFRSCDGGFRRSDYFDRCRN